MPKPKVPTKAQQLADQRKWRAEDMVIGAIRASPAFNKAVKQAMAELARREKAIIKVVKKAKA